MADDEIFFSLIVCTYGRRDELARLLRSVERQTFQNFEIVLIDQNEDELAAEVIKKFNDMRMICKKMPRCGLSAARNAAIKTARGKFCAFPDDDCYFPDNLLQTLYCRLHAFSIDGLSVQVADAENNSSAGGVMSRSPWQKITKYNVWYCGNSSGLFLKRNILIRISGFNEQLGIGANGKFQSGEDTEILLRLIAENYAIYYTAQTTVVHPPVTWRADWCRAFRYGCGGGWVLAHYDYPLPFALLMLFWKLFLTIRFLAKADLQLAKFHFFMGIGKISTFVRHYRHPQYLMFLAALLLSGIVVAATPIPSNDAVGRYAPMADAFARGNWLYAFHPRFGVYFSALAGMFSFVTRCDGIVACQLTGCLFFALSVLPLFSLFKMLWDKQTAIIGVSLYAFCSHLLRYPAEGVRDNGKTLAFTLIALGLVGLSNSPKTLKFGISLVCGMALLTVLRGEGALIALLCGTAGMFFVADWRRIAAGIALYLLLIAPQLAYNTWAIGYPVPETRHAYLLKRTGIPPINQNYIFRESLE